MQVPIFLPHSKSCSSSPFSSCLTKTGHHLTEVSEDFPGLGVDTECADPQEENSS